MPASEAQISANRKNAAKSTGPRTPEGKERSRRNALKHGLAGAGVVLPEADAAEVARRTAAFEEELVPVGEVETALVRRAALNSVRMERAADQQTAALTGRIRQVEADFVAPEGSTEAEAAKLKGEAIRIAMFDPSKEATLARKYEAAAERGFYRALKELRLMERADEAAMPAPTPPFDLRAAKAELASFDDPGMSDDEFDALCIQMNMPLPPERRHLAQIPPSMAGIDLPITVGRPR